jgi:hypothetical protein
MKIMYIGGVADGNELEQKGTAQTSFVQFKLHNDFPSDKLRIHNYQRKIFSAKRSDGEIVDIEFFVLEDMPLEAVKVVIHSRTLLNIIR